MLAKIMMFVLTERTVVRRVFMLSKITFKCPCASAHRGAAAAAAAAAAFVCSGRVRAAPVSVGGLYSLSQSDKFLVVGQQLHRACACAAFGCHPGTILHGILCQNCFKNITIQTTNFCTWQRVSIQHCSNGNDSGVVIAVAVVVLHILIVELSF